MTSCYELDKIPKVECATYIEFNTQRGLIVACDLHILNENCMNFFLSLFRAKVFIIGGLVQQLLIIFFNEI